MPAITNLSEYYKSIGQPLPPISERAKLFAQLEPGQREYTGTPKQNEALLNDLLGGANRIGGAAAGERFNRGSDFLGILLKAWNRIRLSFSSQNICLPFITCPAISPAVATKDDENVYEPRQGYKASEPDFDTRLTKAKSVFQGVDYVWGSSDCSSAVREFYPELKATLNNDDYVGSGTQRINQYLVNSKEWEKVLPVTEVAPGDILYFDGHVEIVTGRGVDHNNRPSFEVWGCRTADSQNKNSGCTNGVFSDKWLEDKNLTIFRKKV